jgi:integrase/recombinase XerD
MKIGELRGRFVAHLEAQRFSAATVSLYLQGIDDFDRAEPERDLRALAPADLDHYAARLSASGLAQSTVTMRLRGLKLFFAYLVETNCIFRNPLETWHERRREPLLGPTLSEAEAERLLSAPNTSLGEGIRDRALLELLYATGLRKKELVGLDVFDVDLAGGLVRVRDGKGAKDRMVPLSRAAARWLGEYLRHIRPRLSQRQGSGTRALFLTRSGRPLSRGALDQVLLRHSQAAGLARVSCHALRRTMATALLRGGADVRLVAEILGHARLSTTERYTKLVVSDLGRTHAKTHPRGDDGETPAR